MTLERQGELLTRIGQSAVAHAPAGWMSINISIKAKGNSCSVSPVAETGEGARLYKLGRDGVACMDLRDAMYQPGIGTWYLASITIDSDGQLDSDFDYDAKPYEADDEGSEALRDLLMYDQERYPRDNEHLPDWHPAKQ